MHVIKRIQAISFEKKMQGIQPAKKKKFSPCSNSIQLQRIRVNSALYVMHTYSGEEQAVKLFKIFCPGLLQGPEGRLHISKWVVHK
jgi:hypothetical protein